MATLVRSRAFVLTIAALAVAAFSAVSASANGEPIVAADSDLIYITGPEPAKIRIIPHSSWQSMPPKGTEADGVRRNLGPGHEETFKSITVGLLDMSPAAFDAQGRPVISAFDSATISLAIGDMTDSRTVDEGAAFNFGGYHIQIPAIHAGRGELGEGLTVVEIATIESLPPGFADSTTAGGPQRRLRVSHTINKLTLHHSNSPHAAGEALGPKLQGMQSWGESDRKWWDIPYHYMVDLDGTVFQARDHQYAGDTNTPYDPRGHFLINCYGNYDQAEPNEAQLATIANLMAWAAIEYDIEPSEIFGHRDLAETTCPGGKLYRYVEDGTLQHMVEEAMAKGQPKLIWLQ
jgi:hypothetical protein